MRELDVLLLRFLERDYPLAPAACCAAFEALLDCQDPEILALLNGRVEAEDEALRHVVQRLLVHD